MSKPDRPRIGTRGRSDRQRDLGRAIMLAAIVSSAAAVPAAANDAVFTQPTYSSPIALSADNRLLWSVNPGDDSVSVLRTDNDAVLRKIRVGNEPQSIALDPNNRYAYVANAASSSVTVIAITNPKYGGFAARAVQQIKTGAEPWNIVTSPDGKRVFVANSGQDTITVINALNQRVIGNVDLRRSLCNNPDRKRHFQPRGLAVSLDNKHLFVTQFLSFTKPGGRGADDEGEQGLVCRLAINTNAKAIGGYQPAGVTKLAAQPTGFITVDRPGDGVDGDGVPDESTAFPNQLQSIVIRGDRAYLPNIAASPESPLQFQNSTQAYVNVIGGIGGASQSDLGALNLHLGARDPEPPKKKLFFPNQWAIAFTTQAGAGHAYSVAAGSDLLVKLNVDAAGGLSFTVDDDTTRYIDLNDPNDAATSGDNAGKNPQGIVITADGAFAYVPNFVSRNISKVDLAQDKVVKVIRTTPLPPPTSLEEQVLVGAEMFFSSRGHFDRPATATISTDDRLSQEAWQNCASCHFKGLTDGVVWVFGPGPRKSIPLGINAKHPGIERILNYSAQREERQDFELNTRNVSGPGNVAVAEPCSAAPPDTSLFDKNHGLLVGDLEFNKPPCIINDLFLKANTGRSQVTVTLPGSTVAVPAQDALDQWMRLAVRVPNGPLTDNQIKGGVSANRIAEGRQLFKQQQCSSCHNGVLWSNAVIDFTPPANPAEIFCERNLLNPALPNCATDPVIGNPNGGQFLDRFLKDVGSYNRGVAGAGNELGNNIGGIEKSASAVVLGVARAQQDALGIDFNDDGAGIGFGVSSLLGIYNVPPYGHNGSCETVACVVGDVKHRTANGTLPDRVADPARQAKLVDFVESIDLQTKTFP